MVTKLQPSRAEAEDIANAVIEGCDGFILGTETSNGKNPIESVIELGKAIAEAENIIDYEQVYEDINKN